MNANWRAMAMVLGMVWSGVVLSAQPQPVVPPEYERSGGPYVPTPNIVVEQMLKLAQVGAGDHVIDLGSGDGIIVLTAARQLQASGYGVDIDEVLVQQSNERARNFGLADRVTFEVKDIFKADVSKATVVTLYLLPEMMAKLRSKLFSELRPGTRVVSHDYHFEEWQHDAQIAFDVPEKEFISGVPHATLYLWVVPARVTGNWRMQVTGNGGYDLALSQRYQTFEGTATSAGRKAELISPRLQGTEIRFVVSRGAMRGEFSGRVNGDRMDGTVDFGDGKTVRWNAVRSRG